MIRVVVTGSECTGKTTLARSLAEHLSTVWVPEYVRQYVEEKGTAPEYRDVERIARGQIALEDSLAGRASQLLIQDSDLLSTVIYSKHYFGDCPPWVEQALADRSVDLYLLAGIDVPWAPDGDQRDRGDRRQEMQDLFRQALEGRGLRFVEVQGSREHRLNLAISAIQQQLSAAAGP